VEKNVQLYWNYYDIITKGDERPEFLDKRTTKY